MYYFVLFDTFLAILQQFLCHVNLALISGRRFRELSILESRRVDLLHEDRRGIPVYPHVLKSRNQHMIAGAVIFLCGFDLII